jgi:hypothetical protein
MKALLTPMVRYRRQGESRAVSPRLSRQTVDWLSARLMGLLTLSAVLLVPLIAVALF